MESTPRSTTNNRLSSSGNSFKRKILRMYTYGFLLLMTYFLISDYFTTLKHAEELTLQRLEGIVRDLAMRIDGDQHQQLIKRYQTKDAISNSETDPDYQSIHNTLQLANKGHGLQSPIYTFINPGKEEKLLEFVVTSSKEPYFLHRYTSLPDCAYSVLAEGGSIKLYKDEFGHWLSAIAPIKNSQNQTVAYVQADRQFDLFISEVRWITLKNALVSLLGFGLVLSFLIPILRRTLQEEEENKRLLRASLEETKRLSNKLEENEHQLKKNAAKLEQSNKDLTDFAHIASHDLKTPIRTINSFASLIVKHNGNKLDEPTQEYLGFIIKNASRAQKLISGLLSYSTADKDLGEQLVVKMYEIGEAAHQSLTALIEEKEARVILQNMPYIKANSTLISQVLQNLINNGLKYNQSALPKVEVGYMVDVKEGPCFFVRDNGIGIPEEYQQNIFQMFTRLHNSSQYEGSGIGLAFCNRVVAAYGGKMWLKSSPEKGSTFYFTLPDTYIEQPILS